MKGFLFDENLPARLRFDVTLSLNPAFSPRRRGTVRRPLENLRD
jgi:ribosomal protein S6E (S10)